MIALSSPKKKKKIQLYSRSFPFLSFTKFKTSKASKFWVRLWKEKHEKVGARSICIQLYNLMFTKQKGGYFGLNTNNMKLKDRNVLEVVSAEEIQQREVSRSYVNRPWELNDKLRRCHRMWHLNLKDKLSVHGESGDPPPPLLSVVTNDKCICTRMPVIFGPCYLEWHGLVKG